MRRLFVRQFCSSGRGEIEVQFPKYSEFSKMPKFPELHAAPNSLLAELQARITMRGPITVSDFMNSALEHPVHGYYMRQDVFGTSGDFTTSPEISQVFGEMLGIWSVATWQSLGCPEKVKLVELGPGRGTLMSDIIRTVSRFPDFCKALHGGGGVCMVETSHALRDIQQQKLNCRHINGTVPKKSMPMEWDQAMREGKLKMLCPMQNSGLPQEAVKIEWLRDFNQVPDDSPVIILAQELFDALPIYQFEFTKENEWREKLVDIVREEDDTSSNIGNAKLGLRFVIAENATPASKVLIDSSISLPLSQAPSPGDSIEIGAAGAALAQDISKLLMKCGGGCVIIDYGDNEAATCSLRGIKSHEFVHPLLDPGQVDLSADVNFDYLKHAVRSVIKSYSHQNDTAVKQGQSPKYSSLKLLGPVTQGEFLRALGIEHRVASLLSSTDNEDKQQSIFQSFKRLVEAETSNEDGDVVKGMGVSYKAMGMVAPIPSTELQSSIPGFNQ